VVKIIAFGLGIDFKTSINFKTTRWGPYFFRRFFYFRKRNEILKCEFVSTLSMRLTCLLQLFRHISLNSAYGYFWHW